MHDKSVKHEVLIDYTEDIQLALFDTRPNEAKQDEKDFITPIVLVKEDSFDN